VEDVAGFRTVGKRNCTGQLNRLEKGESMFDWFREWITMRKRGLVRAHIMETTKRAEPIEVTQFLNFLGTKLPDIPLTQSALDWVHANIIYKSEEKDFWKFPNETLTDGFGDCDDGAILLACLYLARKVPYHEVLVNVYETPAHVAVTVGDSLRDWTQPALNILPSDWKLWYCFNKKHAYTTKEHVQEWKK